jgi:hypothetical protein
MLRRTLVALIAVLLALGVACSSNRNQNTARNGNAARNDKEAVEHSRTACRPPPSKNVT